MRPIEQIDTEMAAYLKAMQHADKTTFAAMATHVHELLRERCRAMGLSEDEIIKIEHESDAAVDQQIADEIRR